MKKRLFVLLISIVLIFGVIPTVTATGMDADTSWYNNTDTSFTLYDAADLAGLASLVNAGNGFSGKTIVLGNSIDLNNEEWTPIGTSYSCSFSGTFDGSGYSVSGLYINSLSNYQGLFGYIRGATVKNLTVSGSVSGNINIGGVVGFAYYGSTVSGCANIGTVNGAENIGGVVGFAYYGSTVSGCTNSGEVSGTKVIGGVVGSVSSSEVRGCTNSSKVSGTSNIGGVVGYALDGSTVTSCTNNADVSGEDAVGGVVGYAHNGEVSGCTNNGDVTGDGYFVGGVAGCAYGSTVSDCCNSGGVICNGGYAGGVVGNSYSNTVTSCYSVGKVSGSDGAGGVVGYVESVTISNTYYLDSAADSGVGSDSSYSGATAKTVDEFASGEVAYLLNGGTTDGSQAWYQNIDNGETVDRSPVLDSTHGTVYSTATACDGSFASYSIYSNSSNTVIHVGSSYDSNGFCTRCGNGYQPATQNSDGVYEITNTGQLFWFASLVNGDTTQEDITAAVADASAVLTDNID